MKYTLAILLFVFSISNISGQNKTKQIRILNLNIWHEGTIVDGGYNAIVDEVERLTPDFATFSEVRNLDNTDFSKRIVRSLKDRGLQYYSFKSYDSGLLSKYPIIDSAVVFGDKGEGGTIHKLVADVDGKRFAIYVAHLDYLNCAYYLPRGYDGNTWKRLRHKVSDIDEIREMGLASQRLNSIKLFVTDAQMEFEKGSNIILGGDFNEPSHLDWIQENKNMYDHNGVVYPWEISILLQNNGFVDSYREKYPSVLDYPGFTYPSANKDVKRKKLTWAPKSDERDRIDFIYYKFNDNIKLKDIKIVGPKASIRKKREIENTSKDEFIEPLGVWPSDHKGIFAVFEIK